MLVVETPREYEEMLFLLQQEDNIVIFSPRKVIVGEISNISKT